MDVVSKCISKVEILVLKIRLALCFITERVFHFMLLRSAQKAGNVSRILIHSVTQEICNSRTLLCYNFCSLYHRTKSKFFQSADKDPTYGMFMLANPHKQNS